MSQPIPNLPHFPIDPAASGAVFEQIRNELEVWCRSVADNMGRLLRSDASPWLALRVLRVTGAVAAGWYTTREQQLVSDAVFDPSLAFDPAAVWEDVDPTADDSYLVDANPSSALDTGGTLRVASWFQVRDIEGFPTFLLMAGAGGALPTPQYQYQVLSAVAQRQVGFDWPRLHAPV